MHHCQMFDQVLGDCWIRNILSESFLVGSKFIINNIYAVDGHINQNYDS